MDIQHTHSDNGGRFFINDNGHDHGELVYQMREPNIMTIVHTQVDDTLKGKGAGKQLVDAAVAYARKEGWKINPVCPFANAVMHKGDAYKDVLAV